MKRDTFISVVVPAFNEEDRLPRTLGAVWQYMSEEFEQFEIVVVDDGSTDGTAQRVERIARELPGIRLLQNGRNRGKGYSVRKGVLEARGELVLVSDADLSTPIEEVQKLLGHIGEGYDVAIGSRALKGAEIQMRQPWYRERMGKTFNLFVRLMVVGGFRDTQCGFKLFRAGAARGSFEKSSITGFGYDVEVLFLAGKMGHRIIEVPVRWRNSPQSKVRVLRDSAKMFLELVRIRIKWSIDAYGLRKGGGAQVP